MSNLQQQIQKYIDEKKELYRILMKYIEKLDQYEDDFQNLIKILNNYKLAENSEEMEKFLQLITNIADNHHRGVNFILKIKKILLSIQCDIKQTLPNLHIYEIFQNNKVLLLFLLENNILILDEIIYNDISVKVEANNTKYCHFFYPEIKKFIGDEKTKEIEEELLSIDSNIFNNFDQKRHEGENDSYICYLIRQDMVKDFIVYVNRGNISLTNVIEPSIFETNSFLINNEPTLIEYAAFFGSIQIFQYLCRNNVHLSPSLWIWAIHGKNAELIHLLEFYKIEHQEHDYEKFLIESIKCHHNNFANYILNHFYPFNSNKEFSYNERLFSSVFQYHNYAYLPYRFSNDYEFYYLCFYKFFTLVDLYMKTKEKDIELQIIIFFVFLSNFILQFNSISNSI
ncbi:hypothetical protein M9Y10_031814 [Tritrichomonas musculus]|uniref:DUF3447 domain-containing protein n=1 Tax=Tritrichomonas musculus TaxID=1915356 RepID=A0ABR2GZU2_9EUKA